MVLGLPYGPWRVLEEEPRRQPLLRLPRELKAELYDGTDADVYCRGFEVRLTTGAFSYGLRTHWPLALLLHGPCILPTLRHSEEVEKPTSSEVTS